MSEIKKNNNQPSKYKELHDFELEVVCGGAISHCSERNTNGKYFIPESVSFTKSEAA